MAVNFWRPVRPMKGGVLSMLEVFGAESYKLLAETLRGCCKPCRSGEESTTGSL